MKEPIFDPEFWKQRLASAIDREAVRCAVFDCSDSLWTRINSKHRDILKKRIGPVDSVLDVGCGWGRLLSLMPSDWKGDYAGVDVSPDFLEVARRTHAGRMFLRADARDLTQLWRLQKVYDWAVLLSVRPMVIQNAGQDQWDRIETNLRKLTKRILYLEYEVDNEGSVE